MHRYNSPPILRWIYPSFLWSVPEQEKNLYLTFDDGPHPEITPWVLELLSRYNAKATFFCVGENVERHPDTFARILEAGHGVGNHTLHHLNGWKTPLNMYVGNALAAGKLIDSRLFRPPYGRITRRQFKALQEYYKIVMWSVLSRDYVSNLNHKEAKRALNKYSGPGSIVLFHDSSKCEMNLRVLLPWYLELFSGKGYTFKALNS